MPTSRVSGNQIDTATEVTISGLTFDGQSGEFIPPKGTTAQRPQNPAIGMIRFNTTEDKLEQYLNIAQNNQPGWKEVKGGGSVGGLGEYSLIRGNSRSITENIIIPSNADENYAFENCFTVGPEITITSGNTVTVPDGSTWTIVETGLEPNTLDTGGVGSIIGPQWMNIGSGDGLGAYQLIRGNPRTISQNIIITYDPSSPDYAFEFAYSVGSTITIASGYTVTVQDGASYRLID